MAESTPPPPGSASGGPSVALRIRLPFPGEEGLFQKFGRNFFAGGVFIATRSPKPTGTCIAFELLYAGGGVALRGEGVITSATLEPPRPGMAVQFTRLDAASKALVDRIREGQAAGEIPAPAPAEVVPAPKPQPSEAPALTAAAPKEAVAAAVAAARARAAEKARPVEPEAAPPAPSEMVIGIDLGTTNSRVAVVHGGKPSVLGLRGGPSALPSVVSLDERGRLLVGLRARAQLLVDPKNTVFGSKRLLGRRYEGQRVQQLVFHFPYDVVADAAGDAAVVLRGDIYPLVEITAHLLRELKEAAQESLGVPVNRAVISVPAYYRDRQRAAVREAAAKAGLGVERLVSEPTATAVAFGYGRGLARKRVLVYDLGGGTFDASVLEVTGDELDVIATGGDDFLGGQDFDDRLCTELTRRFLEGGHGTIADDAVVRQRLRDAAEAAKIELSHAERAKVLVPWVGNKNGAPVDLQLEITRAELEKLTADLVERTLEVTRGVLEARGLKPEQMDEVVITGGQTQMPLVRRRVAELFQKQPRTDVDPHDSVALGAGLLGASIAEQRELAGIQIREVLASPIGLAQDGRVLRLLDRNTPLPAEKTMQVRPPADGELAEVAFFQGDSDEPGECEFLGSIAATPPPGRALQILVRLDREAVLHVMARDSRTGRDVEARLATVGTQEQVRATIARARTTRLETIEASRAPTPPPPAAAAGGLLGNLKRFFGPK